jgi:two-component system CheB/CheR fusion protein
MFNEETVDAINRRGKELRCTITCTPLSGPREEIRGVILLMEEHEASAPTAP